MEPLSIPMLIFAMEESDQEFEAKVLREMHPGLEVIVIREPKKRSLQHLDLDRKEARIFGFMLPPRLTHSVSLRVRWRYARWPAGEWKQLCVMRPEFQLPDYPQGPLPS